MTPTASRKPLWSRAWFQIAAVLLACAIVYWFRLGTGGLHSTEGHRAIPAYEILESGDWLVTTMFGQPYLRKPPGMPCAIAISTMIFGESAWSARAVSALAATLMALVALRFARLWFGPAGGLAAALTCALTPWLLESGRAAEIEALNTLGTMLAAYGLIHVGVARGSWRAATVTLLGVVILTLAKGPASVPLLIGVLAAIGITTRWRTLASPKLIAPVILGFAVFGAVAVAIALLLQQLRVDPVTQSPAAFAFEPNALLGIAALPFAAFAASLPGSLALLFPWGPDARSELPGTSLRWTLARTLALAWVITIAISMLSGLSNVRYTLPAFVLIPPLAGYVVWMLPSRFTPTRRAIARALLLGRPWIWCPVLIGGAVTYIFTIEAARRSTSGEPQGREIAEAILAADPSLPLTIVANEVVEARPESVRALAVHLRQQLSPDFVKTLWRTNLDTSHIPHSEQVGGTTVFVLRTENTFPESRIRGAARERNPDLIIWSGTIHKYEAEALLWISPNTPEEGDSPSLNLHASPP